MSSNGLEPQLTPDQRFRLVEIAHETKDEAVRAAALEILRAQRMIVFNPEGADGTLAHWVPWGRP